MPKTFKNNADFEKNVKLLLIEELEFIGSPTLLPTIKIPGLSRNRNTDILYNLEKYIPINAEPENNYRATIYPGSYPCIKTYPAGSILIFDATPKMFEEIKAGSDVIFRIIGEDSEPGLRRVAREPGIKEAMLVPLENSVLSQPIPFNGLEVELIGVVVCQIIYKNPV